MTFAEIRKYSVIACSLLMSYSSFAMEMIEKTKAALTYADVVSIREKNSLSAERMREAHSIKQRVIEVFQEKRWFPQALERIIFGYFDDNSFSNGMLVPISRITQEYSVNSCLGDEDDTRLEFKVYDIDVATGLLLFFQYALASDISQASDFYTIDVTETSMGQALLQCVGQRQSSIKVYTAPTEIADAGMHFSVETIVSLSHSFVNTQVEPVFLSSHFARHGQIDSGVFLAPGLNGKDFARSLMLSIEYMRDKMGKWSRGTRLDSLIVHYQDSLKKQLQLLVDHDDHDDHVVPFLYSIQKTFESCLKNQAGQTQCLHIHRWFEQNVVGWKNMARMRDVEQR